MRRDIYDMFFLLRKLHVIENVPVAFWWGTTRSPYPYEGTNEQ